MKEREKREKEFQCVCTCVWLHMCVYICGGGRGFGCSLVVEHTLSMLET